MTKQRYTVGDCAARSKVHGDAAYVWVVNFNNGNVNDYHRDNNNAFGRAVRRVSSSECQGAVSFQDLYTSWRAARAQKKPSANQLAFDTTWATGLLRLQDRLNDGAWSPAPAICFVARRPKARQIHAPDFSDRIVHHWLVPKLEAIWEPRFIHDSYANRCGKGSHAAVDRLQKFVREVDSGEGPAWYLQLDIANFFNSIHRPTLYAMLSKQLARTGSPMVVRRATHALLRHPISRQGVTFRCTAAERALVPPHKRLENAEPGCGLPIGNLSSQFFANVYLDALDQFVKHTLKCRRYLRYVDDFVLVHRERAQLERWRVQIEHFIDDRLRLRLKADVRLRPAASGIDFLGFIVYAHHRAIRPRVVRHARAALADWGRRHVRTDRVIASPAELRSVRATWQSYLGHFEHANARGLVDRVYASHPWLRTATSGHRRFAVALEHRRYSFPITGSNHG